ncbi:hypothetical protein V3218_004586, partial [Escherichia coli]
MLGGADNPNGELPSYITGADNLDIAQTARIQEGCPALVGCEQAFQRLGLKITTTSGHPPSSPLLFRINQN